MRIPFGLCDRCVHQRRVGTTRGSTFSLCGRSRTDDRFPRYPPVPVVRCDGFERRDDDGDGDATAPGRAGDGRAAVEPDGG